MIKSFKNVLVGGALVVAVAVQATGAMAAGFTVVNTNQQRSVQNVWYALAGEPDPWHTADVEVAVAPGSVSTFNGLSGQNCLYDIKIQYSDGYTETFDNVNVCRYDRVIAT